MAAAAGGVASANGIVAGAKVCADRGEELAGGGEVRDENRDAAVFIVCQRRHSRFDLRVRPTNLSGIAAALRGGGGT